MIITRNGARHFVVKIKESHTHARRHFSAQQNTSVRSTAKWGFLYLLRRTMVMAMVIMALAAMIASHWQRWRAQFRSDFTCCYVVREHGIVAHFDCLNKHIQIQFNFSFLASASTMEMENMHCYWYNCFSAPILLRTRERSKPKKKNTKYDYEIKIYRRGAKPKRERNKQKKKTRERSNKHSLNRSMLAFSTISFAHRIPFIVRNALAGLVRATQFVNTIQRREN